MFLYMKYTYWFVLSMTHVYASSYGAVFMEFVCIKDSIESMYHIYTGLTRLVKALVISFIKCGVFVIRVLELHATDIYC